MRGIAVMYHPANLWPFSGSERRFVSLSKVLKQYYEVEFDAIETIPTIDHYMCTFHRSYPIDLSSQDIYLGFVKWLFYGLRMARGLLRKITYDFVYATNNNLYNLLLGYLISRLSHLPLIVVVHHFRWIDYRACVGSATSNFSFNQTYNLMKRNGLNAKDSMLRTAGAFFENVVLRGANASITISRTVASQISSLGIKNPIYVSGNGIDFESVNSIVKDYANDDPVYDAVYVGRLDEGKGLLDLLDVWRLICNKLTRAKIAIVGNGTLRNKAEVFVKEKKLVDNVKFLGYIDDSELILTVRRSRLFVTLSTTEGWGLAIAEALACGLPVVAYAIPTLCETFSDCSTVKFAEVGDREQVMKIIIDYLTSTHQPREIAKVSEDFASRLDWKTVAQREYEAIRRSCSNR